MYEAIVEGHLVVCEWVVGVDGMFHAFLLPPTSSVRFGKSKLSPIFFGSLGPLQQLSQKNGVFFLIWAHPRPLFFFPPAAWHLPKVLILQSASA